MTKGHGYCTNESRLVSKPDPEAPREAKEKGEILREDVFLLS